MKSDWQRLLKDTLAVIRKQAGISELPSTKTGFNQLVKKGGNALQDAIIVGVEHLKQRITEYIPEAKDFKPSEKRGLLRRETGLSDARKAAILKGKQLEVSLEHAIVASVNDEGLFNHLALLSGIHQNSSLCKQVAVDLVLKRNESLTLIELKSWDNKSDSPVDALLEISAYFLTYQKMLEFDSTRHGGRFEKANRYNLILMAPPGYFAYWGIDDDYWSMLRSAFDTALHGDVEVNIGRAVIEVLREEFINGVMSMDDEGKTFDDLPQVLKLRISNAFRESMKGFI